MGKVNLRNRIRDNSDQDSNKPQNSGEVQNNIPVQESLSSPVVNDNIPIAEPTPVNSRLKKMVETEPEKEVIQQPVQNIRLNNIPKIEEIKKEPVNLRQPDPEPFIPPVNTESGIFIDEELPEDEKKKGLFGKGNKLFNKKNDNNAVAKVEQGLLDRLNVNKRMLYAALGISGIASFLVISYLQSFSADKLFNSEMVPVLVANKDIAEKSVITADDLAKKMIPKKFVLSTSIVLDDKVDPKSLIGKVALTDIYENEQLTTKRIVAQEESPWLSPAVPVNTRAFTIASKSLSYIKPKDHVDVIVSLVDPNDKNRMINTPVLQNAIVLAVDGKFKITNADQGTAGETVTIAVPNKLVNFFTILQDRGNFQLVLRREGDTTNLDTKFTVNQMEVMLNSSGIKPVEHFELPKPKPIVIHQEPVYIPPPQPVYRPQPVYIAPKPAYVPPKPKPVTAKPKPPAPKPVQEAPPPVSHTTVTVINGTSVHQDKVAKPK